MRTVRASESLARDVTALAAATEDYKGKVLVYINGD